MIFPGMKLVIADHAVLLIWRKITGPDLHFLPEVDMDKLRMGNDFSDAGFSGSFHGECHHVSGPHRSDYEAGRGAVVPLMVRLVSIRLLAEDYLPRRERKVLRQGPA